MIRIELHKDEPLDKALKRFKKVCNNAKIFNLAKKSTYYEKPSDKRRREEKERLKNIKKAQSKKRRRRRRAYSYR